MRKRANKSGIVLTEADAAVAKAMLARGDRQHDIAAWFGVNGGRIAEIVNGTTFPSVRICQEGKLPPRGPYPTLRVAFDAIEALSAAKAALSTVETLLQRSGP